MDRAAEKLPSASNPGIRKAAMASVGDRGEAVRRLLPWWSELVHRVVAAEVGRREEGDDGQARGDAHGPTGVRLRATVDHGAGA